MKQLKAKYADAQTTWNDPLIEAHEQLAAIASNPKTSCEIEVHLPAFRQATQYIADHKKPWSPCPFAA